MPGGRIYCHAARCVGPRSCSPVQTWRSKAWLRLCAPALPSASRDAPGLPARLHAPGLSGQPPSSRGHGWHRRRSYQFLHQARRRRSKCWCVLRVAGNGLFSSRLWRADAAALPQGFWKRFCKCFWKKKEEKKPLYFCFPFWKLVSLLSSSLYWLHAAAQVKPDSWCKKGCFSAWSLRGEGCREQAGGNSPHPGRSPCCGGRQWWPSWRCKKSSPVGPPHSLTPALGSHRSVWVLINMYCSNVQMPWKLSWSGEKDQCVSLGPTCPWITLEGMRDTLYGVVATSSIVQDQAVPTQSPWWFVGSAVLLGSTWVIFCDALWRTWGCSPVLALQGRCVPGETIVSMWVAWWGLEPLLTCWGFISLP